MDQPDRNRQRASLPPGGAVVGMRLPPRAGLGLKTQHVAQVLAEKPDIGFFEVHAENYMVDGGPLHAQLRLVRDSYPLSLHGVGLSIGGADPLDEQHLARLAALIERYKPAVFSEHLAWSTHGGVFYNDLLPLSYDAATLDRVCQHVDQVQERLGRQMLLENPSTYVEFETSTISEAAFIREVIDRTGCGLLLDVNNAFVSCTNHGRDVMAYLLDLPLQAATQIHLAGFASERDSAGAALLIDSHGSPVDRIVWGLYRQVIEQLGPMPSLLERDNDIPPLEILLDEARQAEAILAKAPAALREAAR
ncbi:DUF692 domain-containing protein [Piscinibacter sakaiensis]|uniref:MNIO family bufferin maturase n=1 Tax=Piscinibacter sakaiensis TaxID=1547922 RepID=UPI003AAF3385